jgi:hypothetical protein
MDSMAENSTLNQGPACTCFFCATGRPHPASHTLFTEVSSRLLVAESLDPDDLVKQEACDTCGHLQNKS